MLHAYIGDGKGKTTAAIGLAVRFSGSGKKAEILQFLKDGTSCENNCLKMLNIKITPYQKSGSFFWTMTEEEKRCLKEDTNCGIKYAENLLSGECDMVVMDEILGAVENGLADKEHLITLLKTYKDKKEIVITGRILPEEIYEICDYISEIRKVKHPFDKGVAAKKGIEY